MKDTNISKTRQNILKALRNHSYDTNQGFKDGFFNHRIVRLEEACSVVRYHLNKAIKIRGKKECNNYKMPLY